MAPDCQALFLCVQNAGLKHRIRLPEAHQASRYAHKFTRANLWLRECFMRPPRKALGEYVLNIGNIFARRYRHVVYRTPRILSELGSVSLGQAPAPVAVSCFIDRRQLFSESN